MLSNRVAITKGDTNYPDDQYNPFFHPSERFPEYPFTEISDQPNDVYRQVRELLFLLEMDKANYGTPAWNPLGDMIKPGDNVVIKPNFVRHYHRLKKDLNSVITHASVLRPIMDYVMIALKGRGEIVVADAPQGDANFDVLIRSNGVKSLFDFYNQKNTSHLLIELRDLRKEWTVYKHGGIVWERIKLVGDKLGYSTVALDEDSEFKDLSNKNYYGADYDRDKTRFYHNEKHNRYNVANTILNADAIISVPKLKVHRKVGVTLNIKNLIGINGEKNYLPHFVIGSPEQKGDEFSRDTISNRIDRNLKDFLLWKHHGWGKYVYLFWHVLNTKLLKQVQKKQDFIKGDWWGNDTTWRSAVDLSKIVLYADKNGQMHSEPQRKYLSIIDGIVGGELEGPLTPDPVYSGVMIAGQSPLTTDIFATVMMGLDWKKVKMFVRGRLLSKYPIADSTQEIYSVRSTITHDFTKPLFHFKPASGWMGHLEVDGSSGNDNLEHYSEELLV